MDEGEDAARGRVEDEAELEESWESEARSGGRLMVITSKDGAASERILGGESGGLVRQVGGLGGLKDSFSGDWGSKSRIESEDLLEALERE